MLYLCSKFERNTVMKTLFSFAIWFGAFGAKKKKKKKKKKNVKKIGEFLRIHISGNAKAISLKFGMWGGVYGGHKICKFGTNLPGSYEDTRGWNRRLRGSRK